MQLFDVGMEEFNASDPIVSYLFGGFGDARHLYKTLLDIVRHEKTGQVLQKKYHFTIVDINFYALSRDLIMFMLLQELSEQDDLESDGSLRIVCTIYYIYISAWMPASFFDHLQRTISSALRSLRAGKSPVPWLHIHPQDISGYIHALSTWQSESLNILSVKELMKRTLEEQLNNETRSPDYFGPTYESFKQEKLLFRYSGILLPQKEICSMKKRVCKLCWTNISRNQKPTRLSLSNMLYRSGNSTLLSYLLNGSKILMQSI